MRRWPVWIAAVALSAAVALPSDAAVARTDVSASAACDTATKRLNKFKRGMKAAKRRYFKTHSSRRARARFVKARRAKLKRLKRARARCLANQAPGSGLPGPDPPGGDPPGGGPPGGDPPGGDPPGGSPDPPAGPDQISIGDGRAFLVANAEGDDDVQEFPDPNFSGSVSAADKDATASGIGTSSLQVSSTGMEFTGSASISASDDGGGGDASVYIDRLFTLADEMPFKLTVDLGIPNAETTSGRVQMWLPSGLTPLFGRTTAGSQTFTGTWQSERKLVADVGCSPGNEGGTCTGSFSFTLEVGDMIGP